MRRKLARLRVELSQLARLLDFTPRMEERLVLAMVRSRDEIRTTERDIDKLQRAAERKRSRG